MPNDKNRITVGMVHRHQMFLEGLKALIESSPSLDVVGEGTNKASAYRIIRKYKPDVLLLDANLMGKEDLKKSRELVFRGNTEIILLSNLPFGKDYMITALECDIHGFILKDITDRRLIESIIDVYNGDYYLHSQACNCLVDLLQNIKSENDSTINEVEKIERPLDLLTSREWEVLELLAQGASNQCISAKLDISEATVKAHVSHIIKKLGVEDRVNIALLAITNGWVKLKRNNSFAVSHDKGM